MAFEKLHLRRDDTCEFCGESLANSESLAWTRYDYRYLRILRDHSATYEPCAPELLAIFTTMVE